MTGQLDTASPPETDAESNREMIAKRLGWPAEAVGNCRELEARFPQWYCWWTPMPYPPGERPVYGAALVCGRLGSGRLYAATPAELGELIAAEEARRAAGVAGG